MTEFDQVLADALGASPGSQKSSWSWTMPERPPLYDLGGKGEETHGVWQPDDKAINEMMRTAQESGADQGFLSQLWAYLQERKRAKKDAQRAEAAESLERGRQNRASDYEQRVKSKPNLEMRHEGGNPLFEPDEFTREGQGMKPGIRDQGIE